jgi:membrane protease YdiL (CAAX protease family)
MKISGRKLNAVVEVILIRFIIFPFLFWLITKFIPGFQLWQTEKFQLPFPVTGHMLMVIVAFFMVFVGRRNFVAYGLTYNPLKYHLDIAGTCFLPVVLASVPFGLGIDYRSWSGAWILALVELVLFFVISHLLKEKPGPGQVGLMALSWIALGFGRGVQSVGVAIAEFVTYGVFVGFGEEILFRGYIQSRLNEAFGKPYQIFGIQFGWGLIIASVLFGLTHVGLITSLIDGEVYLYWAWGFWTILSGMVFGIVREKSGSIFAPALLHGLPQAIASSIMVAM